MALCSSCRRTVLSRIRSLQTIPIRSNSTVSSTPNAASAQPPPPSSISIDSSSSTPALSSSKPSISQPLSTKDFPSTSSAKTGSASGTKDLSKANKLRGSLAAGQELRGVGYTKATPKVVAKEDDEYPAWLWTLLDEKKTTGAGGDGKVDLAALTKKQRAKYERKQEKLLKNIPKPIPVHEQSQDLTKPGDDAMTSLRRRQEVTKSARVARRKAIREDNFLRSM